VTNVPRPNVFLPLPCSSSSSPLSLSLSLSYNISNYVPFPSSPLARVRPVIFAVFYYSTCARYPAARSAQLPSRRPAVGRVYFLHALVFGGGIVFFFFCCARPNKKVRVSEHVNLPLYARYYTYASPQ